MNRQSKQEVFRDGFRDARSERLPGTIHKWGPGLDLLSGSQLLELGYTVLSAEEDLFIVGRRSPKVANELRREKPAEMPFGQWIRHLHDLSQAEYSLVRFRERDNLLAEFANVVDPHSALKFASRFGIPLTGGFGVFQIDKINIPGSPMPVCVTVPLPLARVDQIIVEAQFIRAIGRLRVAMAGAVTCGQERREIEESVRCFANQEGLPKLTLEGSLNLFSSHGPTDRDLEPLWQTALLVADARFRRLCPPKGSLTSPVAVFEPTSTLGLIYWLLHRVLVGPQPILKLCENPRCSQMFSPTRSSDKYCSSSCRRQVSDGNRKAKRLQSRSK